MSRLAASISTLLLGTVLLATIAAVPAAAYPGPRASCKDSKNNTFDYVVVGGGTAGLALATRLAEDFNHSVAVIEAGGFYEQDNGNVSVVPAYCTVNAGTDPTDFNPLVDWGFVTEPQKGLGGRRLHYTRGKTLGGTSARNWLPNAGSLDKWADIAGDDSYRFDKLLPFFQKSVQYTPPAILSPNSTNAQDPGAWRSTGGPLQVSHGKYVDPFGTWVQQAAVKLGMASINGFQSGKLLGSAYVPFTVDPVKSQRSSSESSFLQSLPPKARLQVYHRTLAEKVLLNKHNTATGVRASSNATSFTLHARKEVILSAGVFQSPQLLMLSGIGPAATLAKHNISLRINLPGVGSNLQDHAFFGTQRRVLVSTASAQLNNASYYAEVRQAYNDFATGPLTIPAAGFLAYEKVAPHLRKNLSSSTCHALDTSLSPDWPEIEHLPLGAALGYQRNYPKEDPADGYNYASIASLLGYPFSRGTVSISSSNPAHPPLIDPNYLAHPADVELAIAAVRRQRDFWAQMKDLTVGKETLPGENVTTDEDILDYIKQSIGIAPHAVGTCRMGRKNDTGSVVDSVGRVYGAQRLRVVDASVIPLLPPGHIQAMVYAVAEKIADAILRGL